jgi:hypothetical protein
MRSITLFLSVFSVIQSAFSYGRFYVMLSWCGWSVVRSATSLRWTLFWGFMMIQSCAVYQIV